MPIAMKPSEKAAVLRALKKHVDGLLMELFDEYTIGELSEDNLNADDRKFVRNCIGDAIETITQVLSDVPTEDELASRCDYD